LIAARGLAHDAGAGDTHRAEPKAVDCQVAADIDSADGAGMQGLPL
jgi:hypothetical protein